jgi:1-aminocyclopropane-1-carboxylate deaminase
MENFLIPSPLQKLDHELFREKQVSLYIKRDDLIHPHIQGNKWRKLKYNLAQAAVERNKTLLTFGGAYSNHIYATAAAAALFNFKSIGIIRGEEPAIKSSTLQFAASQGMQLIYVSRAEYKQKDQPSFLENLHSRFGEFCLIPEGGTNRYALQGAEEMIPEIEIDYNYICVPCGTGGTLAGLVSGLKGEKKPWASLP